MPITRPPLLRQGGEEAFAAYQREFDRLYRSGPVTDVLERRVEFPPHASEHVCFTAEEEDRYGRLPRPVWKRERAERIPWVLTALTGPGLRPMLSAPTPSDYIAVAAAGPASR